MDDPTANSPVHVLTDVLRTSGRTLIKPLLMGFNNRHSMLYDVASATTVRWSVGDVAHQRTEGKSWYWDVAGEPLFEVTATEPELSADAAGHVRSNPFDEANSSRKSMTGDMCPTAWSSNSDCILARHEMTLRCCTCSSIGRSWNDGSQNGVRRRIAIEGMRSGQSIRMRVAPVGVALDVSADGSTINIEPGRHDGTQITVLSPANSVIERSGLPGASAVSIPADRPRVADRAVVRFHVTDRSI